jgi:predicted metal-dependent TIM-barrel fold hydrolase
MERLKKYDDFKSIQDVDWTKYVIVVPSEKDREQLMEAFEHIHYSDIDTDFVAVNQLAHEYLDESRNKGSYNNIVVDPELYSQAHSKIKK